MRIYMLQLIFLISCLFINSTSAEINNLKTSIIIPCDFKHTIYLYDLLTRYESQTILPDEVVISISEAHRAPQSLLHKLINTQWAFPVNVILSNQRVYAGENRNKACKIATGDIFICQDADDIPYPNRIEVIKLFFDTHQIDHLMHLFNFSDESIKQKSENVDFFYPESLEDALNCIEKFHNGNIAIKRTVFDKIQWSNMPKSQDVEFNERAYKQFNCIIVLEPLIIYRIEYSSWKFIELKILIKEILYKLLKKTGDNE